MMKQKFSPEKFRPGSFDIAKTHGDGLHSVGRVDGFINSCLGIANYGNGVYGITHLNTGFLICRVRATSDDAAIAIASDIHAAGDWSFKGPDGWKNIDPEIKEKTYAVIKSVMIDIDGPSASCAAGHEAAAEVCSRRGA